MRLLRWGPKGEERPGLLDAEGGIRDLTHLLGDLEPQDMVDEVLESLRALDPQRLELVEGNPRLGPCLAHVPNFFCVGLNYAKHAAEAGLEAPKEPVLFSKASSALSGPNDAIILPPGAVKGDWEAELGVVIGREVSNVSEAEALSCVAGYCVVNDVSERAFQLESTGQWIKGKSAPSFGPTGPYLVTADEIRDPQNLDVWLEVNGERMQEGNTSDMIFSVAEIISYMSRFMTLQPGDLIATGTPQGVGMGMKPQRFLKAGDLVRLGIDGLGEQEQQVVAAEG